jgi:hypothetical protein
VGYLNNTTTVIDAVLTKKGRELLARGDGSFRVTQFALADDEIDYSLYNENHPGGSSKFDEAIVNMPLLEAFPDENQTMKYKLITLPRGTQVLPLVSIGLSNIILNLGQTTTIDPTTQNFEALVNRKEPSGYTATIADSRLIPVITGFGAGRSTSTQDTQIFGNASFARTVNGSTFSIQAVSNSSLFPSGTTEISTTLTIIGIDSGARITVPITVTNTTN